MTFEDFRDPRAFRWVESGVSGLAPLREWDAVATADCSPEGDQCRFVVTAEARLIQEDGSAAVAACLHDALKHALDPPFRALGVRREGTTWAVGAVAIELARLPADVQGDSLMLTVTEEGERELIVDDRPTAVGVEAIVALAGGRHTAFVLRAQRLEEHLWELTVDPL